MRLKPSDIGECWNHALSRMRALKALGFNPRNVLDIGAYHGAWSEVMWHVWPTVYHLIEANPDCEPQLLRTGFRYDIALLSDSERNVTYHKSQTGSGEGNSMYREKTLYPFEEVSARTTTLKKLLGDETYDFVKLDCQGSELDVLAGASHKLLGSATIIQLECQIQQYNRNAPTAAQAIAFMDDIGFRLYDIVEYHYNSKNMLIQSDFLFARKDCGLFGLEVLT